MAGALALLSLIAVSSEPGRAPPGLVLVAGGRTQIGIEPKELVRLLEGDLNSQNYAGSLSAETPRHERAIDSFYVMTTEVTNEQYFVYVNASGARPPEHWGEAAVRDGLEAFYKEEERRKQSAIAQGVAAPPSATFDRRQWWREHWSTSSWAVPPGDERLPVVFVDFTQARGYARWAGLRLPTEFEYERAVRGDTTRSYPWGNDWDNEKYAATSLLKKKGTLFPVASFPSGVSRQGLYDLAGNVWEWTSSAYVPFPGYERRVFEFGYGDKKRKVNALADWDDAQRVVVGGSFQTSQIMARASARRAADPDQSTDALGFRSAASLRPGFDTASAVLDLDLTPNIRPRDVNGMVAYAPDACVAVERWTTIDPVPSGLPPPLGYAVIASHRFALFTPVKALPVPDPTLLDKLSLESGPVPLGFLATSERMLEPDLPAGTYLVSYRARGLRPYASARPANGERDGKSVNEAPLEEVLSLDVGLDHLIFTSLAGQAVRAVRTKIEWANSRESRVEIHSGAPATGADGEVGSALRFELCLAGRGTQKGFLVDLSIRFEPGAIDASWVR